MPRALLALLLAMSVSGCRQAREPAPKDVRVRGVYHVEQRPGLGGEACAEMALRAFGWDLDQDYLFQLTRADSSSGTGTGCYAEELAVALKKVGFGDALVSRALPEAANAKEAGASRIIQKEWRALLEDLWVGAPSIVCTSRSPGAERFQLVVGYSAKKGEVIFHDPSRPDGANLRAPLARFLRRWPVAGSGSRRVVRIRLERPSPNSDGSPKEEEKEEGEISPAVLVRHIARLKQRLPHNGFTIVAQPPFVVIGDDPAYRVRGQAHHTVRWATQRLKQAFFAKDPPHIIDIWLFKDASSYLRNTLRLFGERPSTPYGFYSSRHRALVMNIGTGGGTLVHEMVHPFMEANFPGCPPWFNEGLGSLYEACGEEDGHIRGYLNWRLPGLQAAIRARRVPSFQKLTALSERQFYGAGSGTHYAQARYLCYYLQQKRLLRRFYRAFLASRRQDPTGYEALKRVLGVRESEMGAFQRRWEAFVRGLRYRR